MDGYVGWIESGQDKAGEPEVAGGV